MARQGLSASDNEHKDATITAARIEAQVAAASPALRQAIEMLMPSLEAYEQAIGASQAPVRCETSHQNVAATNRFLSASSSGE